MSRPSNSGHRHLHRRVHRGQAGVRRLPGGPRDGQAKSLQHRDVQRGERTDVPGLVVAAGARRAPAVPPAASTVATSASSAGEQLVQSPARRRAANRRRPAARRRRRLERVAQRVDERRCSRTARAPGRRRPRRSARPGGDGRVRAVHPERRHRGRRLEALTGQQHRVGQEPGELARFAGPPWRGSASASAATPAGTVDIAISCGVRGRLAAEHDGRQAGRLAPQRLDPAGPRLRAAEQPQHEDRCVVESAGSAARLRGRPATGWRRAMARRWNGRPADRCRRSTAAACSCRHLARLIEGEPDRGSPAERPSSMSRQIAAVSRCRRPGRRAGPGAPRAASAKSTSAAAARSAVRRRRRPR